MGIVFLYQAQDLNVIEEVIRMMLEIINSCLTNSLHHNPNLVYALLYKRDLFEQFRTHPSFQDIMQNIDLVITFFSSRLLQAGAELSVERVLEIIKQGVVALPKDRLKDIRSGKNVVTDGLAGLQTSMRRSAGRLLEATVKTFAEAHSLPTTVNQSTSGLCLSSAF
ncbi:hypothetical protein J1605_004877 [Eschrichtius robustus]|uniref:Dymeclin n=1 Tax=Eschrichtius robustus TaxID=9764 RepID=A0AB34HF62_ESCRO|nr:hypothetical protein J1605_004877 [Eschrichtius robustus]